MFLALASYALEITLKTAVESKSRSSTESSLEKLRAQSPIVTEERKLFSDIPSFPLTTTMVKPNIQNKSSATNARPPGYFY